MRRLYSILLTFCLIGFVSAQNDAQICKLGFTTDISSRYCWGFNKPVVTSVLMGSQAEKAGLKMNDIIERISDIETTGVSPDDIFALLHEEKFIKLTVSNIEYTNKEIVFSKTCIVPDAISEEDLSSAFSFYSLEDVQNRTFSCPFKISTPQCPEVIFTNYKTFGFAPKGKYGIQQGREEKTLNVLIARALAEKGLKYKPENPDFIITTDYTLTDNQKTYVYSDNQSKLPQEWRFDVSKETFVKLPIYYNTLIHERNVRYYGELVIRFLDKSSTEIKPYVIWECEVRESFSEAFDLKKYAEVNLPLMFMQYPYPMGTQKTDFRYQKKKFNYTGIYYDMNDLRKIIHVDPASPASQAGILSGDVILKINGIKMSGKSSELSSSYRKFIDKTMSFRDEKTKYTDANGYDKCMNWDVFSYPKIETELKKKEYKSVFSYLFYFEPYISLISNNIVSFEIKRGKEILKLQIKPVIVSMETFENY